MAIHNKANQGVSQLDLVLSLKGCNDMASLPRLILPDHPLHIMHRGNNRQNIFEND